MKKVNTQFSSPGVVIKKSINKASARVSVSFLLGSGTSAWVEGVTYDQSLIAKIKMMRPKTMVVISGRIIKMHMNYLIIVPTELEVQCG